LRSCGPEAAGRFITAPAPAAAAEALAPRPRRRAPPHRAQLFNLPLPRPFVHRRRPRAFYPSSSVVLCRVSIPGQHWNASGLSESSDGFSNASG